MRLLLLLAVLLLVSCGDKPDPWRADAGQLLGRTERLAEAGDIEAAKRTLAELEERSEPAMQHRGRTALVRALIKAGRNDEAAQVLARVPWADKSAAVASELVGLHLAIRWGGLLADGRLASGMIPAVEARDSAQGTGGGAWLARSESWSDWQALLAGGVRMVEREGGQVRMPVGPGLLALARWAHGDSPWSEAEAALAGDPAAQLAAVHLHVAEHDPERALAVAERLWTAGDAASGEAYGALRLWQLRRRLIGGKLTLWPFPAVEARLDALAARFMDADAAAQAVLAGERELGDVGLRQALSQAKSDVQLEVESPVISDLIGEPAPAVLDRPRVWRLALDHDGLRISVSAAVVAAGSPVTIHLSSDYRGAHQLQLWRVDDDALWTRLGGRPRREDLPERPDLVRELTGDTRSATFPDLAEGRWVIAASARACPVVAISSLRVAASALHLQAGVDGVLAWTVGRGDGRGAATPLRIDWQLERDAVLAAGSAWAEASPAWRAGFSEGFLGRPDPAFVSSGAAEEVVAGRAAGAAAAATDPEFKLQQRLASGTDGILRLELPPALVGRAYAVRATVDRPSAHEAAEASWGTRAAWALRAVCWADKPLVRPGETLRFAGLLREHDGEGFRRPERTVSLALRVGGETVWRERLPLDGRGMFAGAVAIPAGAAIGAVDLMLEGDRHQIARCDRLALPAAMLLVSCPDGDSQLAGEARRLRVRAVDAAGAPLAATGIAVQVVAKARDGGALPIEAPAEAVTDLAGEALVTIPTPEGREATWVATLSVKRAGRTWGEHHAWSTSLFPFALEAEPDADEVEAGGVLRVRLRLPAGAPVRLQAVRGDERLGRPWTATGGAAGTAECLLSPTAEQVGADAVLLCADLPGGGEAARRLNVRIVAPPRPGDGEPVACLPASTRVSTGDSLQVTVGTSAPGRDVLLVAGTGAFIHHARVPVAAAAATVACPVTAAWSPEVHLQAVAWMPDRGFATSRRTAVRILPIDRLLRVALAPDLAEPRPGETVRVRISVRDWQDRPVAGAGLTLGAVDQRLYALAEDQTPDLWRFFHDHSRPWRLADGRALGGGFVSGLLWRSVVWRWQCDDVDEQMGSRGAFGSRYGGGRCRAVGAGIEESLGTEADPTIAWLAGVVTDARGEAEAAIELPRSTGTWRLTARAADASAAVMVGEIRTVLRAARRIDLELAAPRSARAGDRLVLPVEIANHGSTAIETRLTCAGTTSQVAVEPRSRRTVPTAWTVPQAAAGAPVRRLGGLLGRIVRLEGALGAGTADAVSVGADVLVVPDGLPESAELMLVAGEDGAVQLPLAIPAGSLVHAELRAWPDVGARRDEELLRWRSHDDAGGAMAWVLAPAGAQRRTELARRWNLLDQSPAAQVVRLAALRLGLGGGGVREMPAGVLGDWLRARARLAGLRLSPPLRRSGGDGPLADQIAIVGTALAEGWGEGQRLWLAARPRVLDSDDALVLALGLDAARLASDQPAQRILAGRLVGVPWSDPLAAVLAAELLPAAGPPRQVELRIAGDTVEAKAGAVWSGQIGGPLAISAPPGSVISLDLRWQAPPPAAVPRLEGPSLQLRVDRGDGFRPLRRGEVVLSGERLLLTLSGDGWHAQLSPPTSLRPLAEDGEVRVCDPVGWDWRLPLGAAEALAPAVAAWRDTPAERAATLGAWRDVLTRLEPVRRFRESTLPLLAAGDGSGRIELPSGGAVLLEARLEGELHWSLVRVQHRDDPAGMRWLELPPLRVGAGEPIPEPAPAAGPMVAALADIPTCPEELDWLINRPLLDPGLVSILVPRERPALEDLLAHPACGRSGHWTEAALRGWLDGEPEFDRSGARSYETLGELAASAAGSRADRRKVQAVLPAPQAPARRTSATLRAWYAAGANRGTAWDDWVWQQHLDGELLESLGYARTLDGWTSFLRRECGLPIRLGPGCSGSEDAPAGDRLGSRELAERGIQVTRERDGTLLLSGDATRSAVIGLSVDWQDRPFDAMLADLNDRLANRGLPPLTLAPDIDAAQLPPVTMRVEAMAWRHVAGFIGKVTGLELRGLRFERQ